MTYAESLRYLADSKGWSPHAAKAILHHAKDGVVPDHRQALFHDWASAHERNKSYASTGLAFVTHELQNAFQGIGRDLDAAATEEEAIKIAGQYYGTARLAT